MAILMSFLSCLYLIWMYIFLFLPTPSCLVSYLSMSTSLSLSLPINVCLSCLCLLPSLLLPSFLLPSFLSLSLTLAVSTFGENSTGAPPGKVLPLSSSSTLFLALRHWVKLASRSFFLCSSNRSCSSLLNRVFITKTTKYHDCSISTCDFRVWFNALMCF